MPAIAALSVLLLLPGALLPWPGGGAEPRATTPVAAVLPADQPGAGIVLGDCVNLRSGPGTAYEVVGRLGGGERVTVLGEAFGWLLVRPAGDLKVYVSKDLLERKGGGIAAVRRDRVNLRSRPTLDGTIVGQTGRGELVRLLDDGAETGPEGAFLAIAAPAEVAFYVHRDLVRLIDPAGPEASGAAGTVAAGLARGAGEGDGASPSAESCNRMPTTPGTRAGAPDADVARAAPSTPAEKALRARDLYLAELDKADIAAMDFRAAQALYEEALGAATTEETRAAARAGRKRVRIAAALQEDYRRRMAPIERMVEGERGEREPCAGK